MSNLTYNGITLPYCNCTSFQQEAIYDDQGNTDWCLVKFDIEVQCLLNANYKDWIDADGTIGDTDWETTTNPATMMRIIRKKLLEPRQKLSYTFNGQDLIPRTQNFINGVLTTVNIDAQNGPKPQYCNIQLFTNTSFIITYKIIAHYWERLSTAISNVPPTDNGTGNMVLFNRWTEAIEIDDKNFSKRIRTGKFMIRSDNYTGQIADEIRSQMAVVGVPYGFLRESSNYTVTPDGLAIQYRIVDKEAFKMPPQPAFKASGRYKESLPGYGAMRHVEVQLKLEGDKNTNQALLLQKAFQICTTKLRMNGITTNFEATPTGGHFVVDMYENIVEVQLSAMAPVNPNVIPGDPSVPVQAKTRLYGAAGIRWQAVTFTPGSDDVSPIGPNYLDRGTADRLLRAAAYFDPSLTNVVLNKVIGQNVPSGPDIGAGGLQVET